MALYSLTIVGILVAWQASCSVARPTADVETILIESNMIEPEHPTYADSGSKPSNKPNWKKLFRLLELVEISRKLARDSYDDVAASTTVSTTEVVKNNDDDSASRPVYGSERILDDLLDHTVEKQPMFHSALDGWIF